MDASALSQEFRFTSNNDDSRFDWIAGAFYKEDDVRKKDGFIGENFFGSVPALAGGNNPLSTLSGESRWDNDGTSTSYAGFAQLGFKITEAFKLSAGVRYTRDEKEGDISALVVETGDRFNPNDPRANVTIESVCRAPDGTIIRTATGGTGVATCLAPNKWTYGEGEGFSTHYSE